MDCREVPTCHIVTHTVCLCLRWNMHKQQNTSAQGKSGEDRGVVQMFGFAAKGQEDSPGAPKSSAMPEASTFTELLNETDDMPVFT